MRQRNNDIGWLIEVSVGPVTWQRLVDFFFGAQTVHAATQTWVDAIPQHPPTAQRRRCAIPVLAQGPHSAHPGAPDPQMGLGPASQLHLQSMLSRRTGSHSCMALPEDTLVVVLIGFLHSLRRQPSVSQPTIDPTIIHHRRIGIFFLLYWMDIAHLIVTPSPWPSSPHPSDYFPGCSTSSNRNCNKALLECHRHTA